MVCEKCGIDSLDVKTYKVETIDISYYDFICYLCDNCSDEIFSFANNNDDEEE